MVRRCVLVVDTDVIGAGIAVDVEIVVDTGTGIDSCSCLE